MFRKNDGHLQEELFSHYQIMNPKIAKMLKDTWAPFFYVHVFCKIDEEVFAPLYCADNGRPNFPVNILLSLELHQQKGCKRGQGANKLRVRGMIKCQLQIGLKVIGHNFKQFYRAINKPKPQAREVVLTAPIVGYSLLKKSGEKVSDEKSLALHKSHLVQPNPAGS